MLGLYRRYPYLIITGAIGLSGLLLYLVPGLDPSLVARYNDDAAYVLIGGVVTFAMARRAGHSRGMEERRLWGWLAISFGLWTGAELIATITPEPYETGLFALVNDVLYFLSYSAWFLGVNQAPHHSSGWSRRQPGWLLEQWGTLIVSVGMALDIGILPQLAAPHSASARFAASGLFVAFDAAVLLRLVALTSRAAAPEWRRWYSTIALMAASMLVMDVIATGIEHHLLPAYHGPWYDLAWYLPFWILAVGCSLPTPQPATTTATDLDEFMAEEGASPLEGGLVYYTSVFVVVHLLAGLTLRVPPEAEQSRTAVALIVVLVLGLLAYRRQLGLESQVGRLSRQLRVITFDLAQAQKLQAVARLAAGIAHDFNNLLTIILGHCELLLWSLQRSSERQDIGGIQEAARRAGQLTADLLTFGDTLPLSLQPHDLNNLLEEAQEELGKLTGSKVSLGIHRATIPSIPADPERLRAAVLHLARNAVDAMPDGGRLTVTTSSAQYEVASPDRPSLVPAGSYCCLSVEDSGPGIDPATQARLFEPYFTTKAFGRGHGLGLAAVHGIVSRHGGYVLVHSEIGRGTRFDLLFPAIVSSSLSMMVHN